MLENENLYIFTRISLTVIGKCIGILTPSRRQSDFINKFILYTYIYICI